MCAFSQKSQNWFKLLIFCHKFFCINARTCIMKVLLRTKSSDLKNLLLTPEILWTPHDSDCSLDSWKSTQRDGSSIPPAGRSKRLLLMKRPAQLNLQQRHLSWCFHVNEDWQQTAPTGRILVRCKSPGMNIAPKTQHDHQPSKKKKVYQNGEGI